MCFQIVLYSAYFRDHYKNRALKRRREKAARSGGGGRRGQGAQEEEGARGEGAARLRGRRGRQVNIMHITAPQICLRVLGAPLVDGGLRGVDDLKGGVGEESKIEEYSEKKEGDGEKKNSRARSHLLQGFQSPSCCTCQRSQCSYERAQTMSIQGSRSPQRTHLRVDLDM